MARAAVLERLTWSPATLERVHAETSSARTLTFDVAGWSGHQPGQHVDVRLTAADGYTAQRAYSIGSAPAAATFDLTVEETPGGEVSPFLVEMAKPGVIVEVRGPLGGWFLWTPDRIEPVQLVGGGSGVVPLMSMFRTHRISKHPSPMRLLYSVRSPADILFANELHAFHPLDHVGLKSTADSVSVLYSRATPTGEQRPARRLSEVDVQAHTLPSASHPVCYVCGPTPFVEAAVALLLAAGHPPSMIRTERFGSGRMDQP